MVSKGERQGEGGQVRKITEARRSIAKIYLRSCEA